MLELNFLCLWVCLSPLHYKAPKHTPPNHCFCPRQRIDGILCRPIITVAVPPVNIQRISLALPEVWVCVCDFSFLLFFRIPLIISVFALSPTGGILGCCSIFVLSNRWSFRNSLAFCLFACLSLSCRPLYIVIHEHLYFLFIHSSFKMEFWW